MQYSLRMLFAAVAVVAIGAALWIARPSWQVGAVESLLFAWFPASAAALSVHSVGKAKTFWMGVAAECILAPAIYLCTFMNTSFALPDTVASGFFHKSLPGLPFFFYALSIDFRLVLVAWAFAPIVGLLCVLTHWLLVRPKD